jgi:hypothetical protein
MDSRVAPPMAAPPLVLVARSEEALTGVRARTGPALVRVRPGLYADRQGWFALHAWERYLLRVHAFARSHPGVVFCLESAAALLGLPVFGEPRDIHVFDRSRSRSRRFGDVMVHTGFDDREVVGDTVSTTSAAVTGVDLMRVLPPAFAVAVGDAVLRDPHGPGSLGSLRDLASDQATRRGRARLEWAWPRITGVSESVGESVSRTVLEWCGFPEPELQQWFYTDGFRDRVDFFWRRWRVIGESDGYGKYAASADSDPLRELKKEKTREDRLRRQVQGLARWDYGDAMRAVPLQNKVLAAGVPRLFPVQPGLLATLRSHPRSLDPSHTPIG